MAVISFVLAAVFLASRMMVIAQAETTFTFNQFNDSSALILIRNASVRSTAVCLTDQSQHIFGRALYKQPLRMKYRESINATSSFSTTFVFSIVPSYSSTISGQGMAFMMSPFKSLPGANYDLGLLNISSNGKPYNHLFAVEFDTLQNEDFDIDDNHVGVDLNNLISVKSERAGYWIASSQFRELDLNSGQNIQAWIDYDHFQQHLNVTIAPAGSLRPEKPLMSAKNLNLSTIFEEEMYMGFSAGTGLAVEEHWVLAWSFTTNGTAPVLDTSRLPSLAHKNSKSSRSRFTVGVATTSVLLVILLAVVALVWWKKKRDTDSVQEWELEYWPHRFSYKDLHIATKGFREEQVVGCGGFGRVYKGILPSNGLHIAVKSILRQTNEGLKEFIAEVSSLGRLQHRNLVQIRGYCRRGIQLFIVYDYMPNGSLDRMICGNPSRVLAWPQRYRILRDVAAGLLYLHEEWEKIVVHRDIKPSNVLLDSELNAKLADFGLARLYEHSENPRTTRVVGTLGYIAPELLHKGKATPASDVFSFGILMLEVACGRQAVDLSVVESQIVLVDWVRELHAKGRLIDAVDPALGGEYAVDEMERVLNLGLLCSTREAEGRVGIRQVLQILEGQASVPEPPLSMEMSIESNTRNTSYDLGPRRNPSTSSASISKSLEGR